jgi:hypothetical protein
MTAPIDVPLLDLTASGDRRSSYVRVVLRINGAQQVVAMPATIAVAAAMRLYEAAKLALTDWKPDHGDSVESRAPVTGRAVVPPPSSPAARPVSGARDEGGRIR